MRRPVVDIERLRVINASGIPLANSTVKELLDELERKEQSLRAERVLTAAAAVVLHEIGQLHNADGHRYFNRGTSLRPDSDAEAYCTHCKQVAPCPTKKILGGETRG